MKNSTIKKSLDRLTLAVYLAALIVLLLGPISADVDFRLLDIEADKWVHVGLFSGLAALLRWNLGKTRHPLLATIAATLVVAVFTEIAQSLTDYRSAEFGDVIADVVGGMLGAIVMGKVMSLPGPEKLVGLIVTALGLAVGGLFVLADVIGVGSDDVFGPKQVAGAILGALIAIGGVAIYASGHLGEADRA